jgi:hypothetical protein
MLWCTVPDEQLTKHIQNIPRVQAPFDADGETLARVLVDHAQHAEDLSIMGAVLDEVIRPDMTFVRRPEPHARSIIQPQPPALGLLLRDLSRLHVAIYDRRASHSHASRLASEVQ